MKLYTLLGFAMSLPATLAAINCNNVPVPGGAQNICSNTSPAWQGCDGFCPQHCGSATKACIYKGETGGDYDCYCV